MGLQWAKRRTASEEAVQQDTLTPLEKQTLSKRLSFGPSPWQSLASSVRNCSLLHFSNIIASIPGRPPISEKCVQLKYPYIAT